jgi:hypothetical protein
MYIPRPAKLLFTIDDGWNKFLDLNSHSKLSGPVSALSACSPLVTPVWVSTATAAHQQTAPVPVFSARPVNQKVAVRAGMGSEVSRRAGSPDGPLLTWLNKLKTRNLS